jgi:hypothetical protein
MKMLLKRGWPLVLGVALVACGSGEVGLGGSGTLEGDGAFAVKAAYFHLDAASLDDSRTTLSIHLLRDPLRCEELTLPSNASTDGVVAISVRFPVGVYPEKVTDDQYAVDNAMVVTGEEVFDGSQLKLETATDDRVVGSFIGRQPGETGQLSGTFDALRCETSEFGG